MIDEYNLNLWKQLTIGNNTNNYDLKDCNSRGREYSFHSSQMTNMKDVIEQYVTIIK